MDKYATVVFNIGYPEKQKAGETSVSAKNKDKKDGLSFNKVARIGSMVLSAANVVNSAVGSYTGNKVRQNNISVGLRFASMGISFAINPIFGAIHLATTVGKEIADVNIRQINSQQESAYRRSYMGNITTSGSRWRN
jgi:hypothetical protein